MEGTRFDVLLQGRPFCDLTFSFPHLEAVPSLGHEVYADDFGINPGGIFNVSSAMSRFGLRVGLMAALGNDMFSRFVAERMREVELPLDLVTWWDRPMPVVTVGVSFRHDRLFLSYVETDRHEQPRLTIDELDRYRPRAVFTYGQEGTEFFDEARRRGVLIYVDTSWHPERLRSERLRCLLPHIDVFAPNLPEALEMTGAATAEEALDILTPLCDCVVIKSGAEGCVGQRDGQRIRVPALPVEVRDTTGAGDNFNAGMLYGLLRGYSFIDCLRCANIAGGLSTEVLGGCASGSTAEDIERHLASLRST